MSVSVCVCVAGMEVGERVIKRERERASEHICECVCEQPGFVMGRVNVWGEGREKKNFVCTLLL